MLMQVHDELVFEVRADAVDDGARRVIERMSGAAELAVPLLVDVGWATTGTRRTEFTLGHPGRGQDLRVNVSSNEPSINFFSDPETFPANSRSKSSDARNGIHGWLTSLSRHRMRTSPLGFVSPGPEGSP
jgi:hypothetical protein